MNTLLRLYSMRDARVGVYHPPFAAANHAAAHRICCNALLQDRHTDVNQYPEDFALFDLGTFNPDTAQIVLSVQPECVYKMHEIADQLRQKARMGQQQYFPELEGGDQDDPVMREMAKRRRDVAEKRRIGGAQ